MRRASRFLVVVRAGDQSLHPAWTSALATRKWDLVISYFGNDPDRFRGPGEIRIDDKGQKYQGLRALFERDDFWRNYDYIWLPDDDLAAEQGAVDGLFEAMARLNLALAQPALSWDSFFSHRVTMHSPSFRMRFTNFVEIMAPCFHRPFLEECVATFGESLSGWGLDWLWPRMLPPNARRCGVIDDAVVTHTRPVGGPTYARLRELGITPQAEAEQLRRKFAIPPGIQAEIHGAIDREGAFLNPAQADDAAALRALLDRDRAAFDAFRAKRIGPPAIDMAAPRRLIFDGAPVKWRT